MPVKPLLAPLGVLGVETVFGYSREAPDRSRSGVATVIPGYNLPVVDGTIA